MTHFIPSLLLACLPLIALIVLVAGIRIGFRNYARRQKAAPPPPAVEICRCGYPLENLSVPRSPECGRVIGFDATPEELGLNDEHLQRAQAARLRRRQKDE